MFGQDNQNDQNQQDSVTPVISPAPDALVNENDEVNAPAAPATGAPVFDTSNVSLGQTSSTVDSASASEPTNDTPAETAEDPAPSATPVTVNASDDDHLLTTGADDDLIHIKQDALQQLSPLVDHLEQTPEEKFRTTMMMIQASDDQSLVKTAYDAAKEITDDKVRAQALLDIINEINYFTQQQSN